MWVKRNSEAMKWFGSNILKEIEQQAKGIETANYFLVILISSGNGFCRCVVRATS